MRLGSSKKGQYAPQQPPGYPQYRPPTPQPGAFGAPAQQPTVSLSPKTLLIIGAVALIIILSFTIILVIRANAPRCPEACQAVPCESTPVCGEETGYKCTGAPIPGCDVALETKKLQCQGKVGTLVKKFDEATEECLTDEDPKVKVSLFSSTQRTTAGTGKFRVKAEMDSPFNLKNDQVVVEVAAEQLPGQNVRVKRIELEGTDDTKQLVILTEDFLDKAIPSEQTPAKHWLTLDTPSRDTAGKLSALKLLVDVAYDAVSGTTVTPKEATLTLQFKNLVFSWLRPTANYACPATCDDKDPTTRDYCDDGSRPFCKHDIVAGACGNGMCEASENKCTCASDCGSCVGNNKVTTSQCVANACRIQLRSDITVIPVKLTAQSSLSKATVTTSLDYNNPFNSRSDSLTVTIRLDERTDDLDGLSIDRVQLLKGGTLELSSKDVRQNLVVQGSTVTATLPLPTALVEEELTPQVKVYYTMTVKGVADQRTYTMNMQKTTVYSTA